MIRHNILYICDLNLANGGAQKNTYKTIKCISKFFGIYIYSNYKPDQKFLNLIQNLNIKAIFDKTLNIDRILELINKYNVEAIIIQWENPIWISTAYKLKKMVGVKTVIMMHELPFINTPTSRIIKNWYILTFFFIIKLLFVRLNELFKIKKNRPKNEINQKKSLFEKITVALNTYNGIKHADILMAMGPASNYYIKRYMHIANNVIEIKHNAASDISCKKVANSRYLFDLCFMAARLEKGKGVLDLPFLIKKIKAISGREIKLVILGKFVDDKIRNEFYRLVDKFDIKSNIMLAGFVPEYKKIRLLMQSRIFVYPSRKDVFSISLAEALSCGLPAVVFKLPFTEQYKTRSVFKIPYKNLNLMASTIVKLLDISYNNPKRYEEMSKEAQRYVRREFNWEKTCKEQVEVIKTLFI